MMGILWQFAATSMPPSERSKTPTPPDNGVDTRGAGQKMKLLSQ